MTRRLLVAAMLIALPTLAKAAPMSVAEFVSRADGLQKMGAAALLSRDLGVLKDEIVRSAGALRQDQAAAERAGRKPRTCLPAKAKITSQEIIAHMKAIPPERRGQSVEDALRVLVSGKYPCPA
jgi:hypothetical protein